MGFAIAKRSSLGSRRTRPDRAATVRNAPVCAAQRTRVSALARCRKAVSGVFGGVLPSHDVCNASLVHKSTFDHGRVFRDRRFISEFEYAIDEPGRDRRLEIVRYLLAGTQVGERQLRLDQCGQLGRRI